MTKLLQSGHREARLGKAGRQAQGSFCAYNLQAFGYNNAVQGANEGRIAQRLTSERMAEHVPGG